MNEADWLASNDPQAMLTALLPTRSGDASPIQAEGGRGGISERHLRLFACAAWRTIRFEYPPTWEDDLAIVAAVEVWADGGPRPTPERIRFIGTHRLLDGAELSARGFANPDHTNDKPLRDAILRDILGNPFRPVKLPYKRNCETWCPFANSDADCANGFRCVVCNRKRTCPWLTETVVNLAQHIYEARDFEAMPVLGDALEEAGCTNEDVLRHCRGQERCVVQHHDHDWRKLRGSHVRGCWVVDLLLNKE